MAELRALAKSLNLRNPVTYIQSGNLIFDVAPDDTGFAQRLETALTGRYGFEIPVVTRSADELERLAREHPLASPELEDRFLMIAFLDREPAVAMDEVIDPDEFGPDRFDQRGWDIYLAYPNGIGRSKLSHHLIQRRLGVQATIRNWRTILRLVELAGGDNQS
jgi:uncharacterized protein (DUF1697 family)